MSGSMSVFFVLVSGRVGVGERSDVGLFAGSDGISAESLPMLDFGTLSDEQMEIAADIFDEFREKDLMPAYLAGSDASRALLDKRVVCDLLGFGEGVRGGGGDLRDDEFQRSIRDERRGLMFVQTALLRDSHFGKSLLL